MVGKDVVSLRWILWKTLVVGPAGARLQIYICHKRLSPSTFEGGFFIDHHRTNTHKM